MVDLLPFQKKLLRAVDNPKYDTVALSGPRGLGKTFLAARVLTRCLTPGDPLHQPGKEYILGAASLEMARLTYLMVRQALEPTGDYRWIDSATRLGATHLPTNTKLRAISSNPNTSFGLVNVPLVVLDEPGALDIVGGQQLADSLFTAQGKVGSKLKLVLTGTLAPKALGPGHWWYDLIAAGTTKSTYVQMFQGDAPTWDSWATIRKANPLAPIDAGFRGKLREELALARADTRQKARFLSYRLNLPTADESTTLLTVDDWQRVIDRPVAPRDGQPVVGIDLGGGRAWSAAVAMWSTGRIEAIAVAPGIPNLEAQERRDRVPSGLYRALYHHGGLRIADGLRVPPVQMLTDAVLQEWGQPLFMVGDRFREGELRDATGDIQLDARVTRWSEAAYDIRALRRMAMDGPLSCETQSQQLLTASLAVAMVKNDDAGNFRLVKKGTNNQSRDDAVAALVLVAGAVDRHKPWAANETPAYSGLVPI